MTACTETLSAFRMLHVRHTDSVGKLLCQPTRRFAMRNAVKALCGPNPELTKVHSSITEKNSVHQFFLGSKAMECSLRLFLWTVLSRAGSYLEFHLQCTDSAIASRFETSFPTYRDICNALRIDPSRENLELTGKRNLIREM